MVKGKKIAKILAVFFALMSLCLLLVACNEEKEGEPPKVEPPHVHTEQIVVGRCATCTENGLTDGKKCATCGEILVAQEVILASHTVEVIKPSLPTPSASGYTKGEKCSVCKEILLEPIEYSLLTMELDEQNSRAGQISATLTFNYLKGNYTIYYADEQRNSLEYYTPIKAVKIEDEKDVEIDGLIIPKNCKYIIASNGGDYNLFVKIPEEYLFSEAEYTFGALSDVHYNKGDYFEGALDFFDEQNVDFVGISGDITDHGEISLFEKFNEAIKDREYKVYTTTGNHDTFAISNGNWQSYMNTTITTDSEVIEIAENGIDFVFVPNKAENNVFIFLCQTAWEYTKKPSEDEYTLLTEEQILWLSAVLSKNKDKNVFLFFHTFLSSPDGTEDSAVGNLKNSAGYTYNLPFSYGSADEIAFRALMKEYKNVVFFSGHSHWMFEMEQYNENLNISNFDGEYCHMVHVPSVCEPRWIDEDDTVRTSKTGEASEGWIVEVYDEAIVLIPVDFISQAYYTEYMKIIPLS